MKRLKIDPDTSAMIKMGLVDCAFEVIKNMLFLLLVQQQFFRWFCESEEEN